MPEIGHNSSSWERKDGAVMLKTKWQNRLFVFTVSIMLYLLAAAIFCSFFAVVPRVFVFVILCGFVVGICALLFCMLKYRKYERENIKSEREEALCRAQEMMVIMREAKEQSLTRALDTLKSVGMYFDEREKSIVVPEDFGIAAEDERNIPLMADAIITLCKGMQDKCGSPDTECNCADAVQKLLYGHVNPMLFIRVVMKLRDSLRWPSGHPLA